METKNIIKIVKIASVVLISIIILISAIITLYALPMKIEPSAEGWKYFFELYNAPIKFFAAVVTIISLGVLIYNSFLTREQIKEIGNQNKFHNYYTFEEKFSNNLLLSKAGIFFKTRLLEDKKEVIIHNIYITLYGVDFKKFSPVLSEGKLNFLEDYWAITTAKLSGKSFEPKRIWEDVDIDSLYQNAKEIIKTDPWVTEIIEQKKSKIFTLMPELETKYLDSNTVFFYLTNSILELYGRKAESTIYEELYKEIIKY